ncbi:hypothetical protein EHS25_006631 [Saitozyma podzolica]|uniref:AN1-type domain-containing protein n=1 Tax=Saitozyma podzolica TaxID=1890683 RepID=A0A427YS66_9TREE|nr:hypothetical protein EHS25_006631 [Saitozyma podzolica]
MAAVQPDRSEMMFLGRECHHPACHLHDFLPFSCPACHLSFCQSHFLPSIHACASPLPPSMVDRIAPQCPLCHEVVLTLPSRDPNEAVERHIQSETCAGLPGGEERKKAELKAKKESGKVCWRKGCSKTLVVNLFCQECGHNFCPTHRHTTSHACTPSNSRTSTPQPSSSSAGAGPSRSAAAAKAAMARFGSKPSSSSQTQTQSTSSIGAAGTPSQPVSSGPSSAPIRTHAAQASQALDAKAAAATAALKRAGQDVKSSLPIKSKTEKRADAEIASTIQALKARHDRGLLTKAEEVR